MRCEDDCIDWETIENAVYSGKTTWIYALTKVELVEICKRWEVIEQTNVSIDVIRQKLSRFVKEQGPFRELLNKFEIVEDLEESAMAAASWFGNIEPFRKGGNWSTFVQQLEAFIMLNNIAADKKAALLLTQVSQEVFAEIPAICETETPLSLTYEALKEKLESHYQPKPNQQLQRFSFRARKQGSNESIRDFMTALRSLALKCQFQTNEINSQLKDQLITGVYNQRVRYELLKASADESLENLLRLAKTVELADAKAAGLETPNVVNTGSTPDNNTTVAQDADIHTIQTGRNRTATNRGRGNFYGQASRRGWSAPRGGGRGTQRSQNQRSQGAGRTAGSERICFCCGGTNHIKANCSLQNKYCSECGNQGHIFKMCRRAGRGGQTRNQNYVGDGETAETQEHLREEFSEDEERFASDFWPVRESGNVECELKKKVNPQFVTIKVNNIPLKMEIDSGAGVSAISKNCYEKLFAEIPLITSKISLRTYDKQKLPTLGYIQVEVEKNYVKSKELLYVVSEGSWPIMGRIWLQAFGMWPLVFPNDPREHINSTVAQTGDDDVTKRKQITCQLQKEFPGVFAAGIGAFTKGELKLTLIEGATPKFLQPRKMPWALRDKVENELARLQQLAIISPVEYSDWGTPIVPVLKSNGTLRLCGDYKVTLNKYLEVDRYPLPRVEEVLETLRGGKIFTKLDLSEAYQQLPLTQESQKLVVISTHIGLFKYHRLPYGVATGPGSFQRVMTSLLLGIPGTIVFIDDILITAATLEIHTDRVREVLKRLNEGGLRLKFEKCKFFKNEVCYLGFRINEEGIRPLEAKIKSVKDAPKPKDVSELRSFLGSINYYGRFIENMAQKLRALYECLEKDKFEWTEVCDKTFEKIKRELVSDKILVHFDPQKQTVLTCDASPYGISAVLAHRDEEGNDRPICFASRTLTSTERNYTHLDKEGLAIIFGVRKYFEYLYGHKFILQTDSAALARIFDPSKAIPEIAAARLQRWALFLAPFEYTIKHIQGKKNYADWLSRLPLPKTKDDAKEFPILQNTMYTHVNCVKDYDFATLDWKAVRKGTREDETLSKVIRYCMDGWEEKSPIDESLKTFWNKRESLTIDQGCVLWGHRVVIPNKLREIVLKELHYSHFGVTRMKALARSFVWWPEIDKQIESITQACRACLETRKSPPKIALTPWAWPTTPWHRIHADFLGPFNGKTVLVIVDSHSKWPEAIIMQSMSESHTIKAFEEVFARHGYPAHLITDNYSTFVGKAFQSLLKVGGVRHSTTPPYCPATNGAAENFVGTFKRKVACIMADGFNLQEAITKFLFDYRSTPHATTQRTPASLALGRELKTRFSRLRPTPVNECIVTHQSRQIQNYAGKRESTLKVGDSVMAREYKQGGKAAWKPGTVEKELIAGVTYLIRIDEKTVWKRHANQLIKCDDSIVAEQNEAKKKQQTLLQPRPMVRRSERLQNKKGEM